MCNGVLFVFLWVEQTHKLYHRSDCGGCCNLGVCVEIAGGNRENVMIDFYWQDGGRL